MMGRGLRRGPARRADVPPAKRRATKLRKFFAGYVAARAGVRDPRIEQAFAAVEREVFAGPGPWFIQSPGDGYLRTPDDDPAFLYQDTLVAIDAGRGINIGEPTLHARCLDALALQPGETVLQVGAGVGYYTAILAHLVGPDGRVHAFEIESDLAARASQNLQHLRWVSVEARSGVPDPLPEVDAVYVNAGITQPSRTWLNALRAGGRLIFPLQPLRGYGAMLLIGRPQFGEAWPARFVAEAEFISCVGRQDEAASLRLAHAFATGTWDRVRSFRPDGRADDTCWFQGDGWWLSTAAPPDSAP
jgi:protein-L-isoaspartate(D-aspartate) O-methyltransferase